MLQTIFRFFNNVYQSMHKIVLRKINKNNFHSSAGNSSLKFPEKFTILQILSTLYHLNTLQTSYAFQFQFTNDVQESKNSLNTF